MSLQLLANSRWLRLALGSLLVAALVAACAPAPVFELNNTNWTLVAINSQPIPAETQATLEFKDGSIGGNAGCNSYGGKYRLEGNKLMLPDPIMSTLMACLEDRMNVEQTLLAALQSNPSAAMQNGQLVLTGDDGTTLTFVPQP